MNGLGNKEIMAKNLAYYVEKSGKTQKDIADLINVPASTFNAWMNGQKYPRIDKIEMLANYFDILKSDLIEDKTETEKNNDAIANIIVKLRADDDFLSLCVKLTKLNKTQVVSLDQMLSAFDK